MTEREQVTDIAEYVEAELVDELSLSELAAAANRYHSAAETSAHSAIECAWHAGEALNAAKAQCNHGDWLPWLEVNFEGSEATAQRYMKLANAAHVRDLNPGTSIRGALAAIQKENRAAENGSAPSAPASKRKAITDQARAAGWNLHRAIERIERIAADDRFDVQMRKVAPEIRGHLANAIESCQALLNRINNNQE